MPGSYVLLCKSTIYGNGYSRFYLTETHNFETIGIVEYRPHLTNDWMLYSRLEGLYNVDIDIHKHDRSFIYGRFGFAYKTVGFGLAMNSDWYVLSKHINRMPVCLFVKYYDD